MRLVERMKAASVTAAIACCAAMLISAFTSLAADKPEDTPEQKAIKTVVTNFLAAAAKSDTEKANSFLAEGYKADIVGEFKANAASGWVFSADETSISSVTVDAGKGTVIAQIVFKGGGTFMGKKRTFSLLLEKGSWKISKMEPPPAARGPGVSPLR